MADYNYRPETSTWDKLTGTTALSAQQAAVIKQTYVLFGVSVFCALAGGYIGATSEMMARFFSGWLGWIVAMLGLNLIPRIAIACRHNPALGVTALVFDGLFAGLALSPLLWVAAHIAPSFILMALAITGTVFIGVTSYVFAAGRTFSAPKGLMTGMFFAIMGAVLLNSFMNIGFLGILISVAIGAFGVMILVYSTSAVLNSPDADSPIPGALSLFAGVFQIFVAVLNLLLRLAGGGRRD